MVRRHQQVQHDSARRRRAHRPKDYNIYSNSQLPNVDEMNDVPLKAIGNAVLRFGDIGHAEDASAIQYNIVRVDGQKSVYLPILQAGRQQQHH